MSNDVVGVVLAVVAALLYSVATVLQAVGGRRAAVAVGRAPGPLDLLRQPAWWAGLVTLGVAFLLVVGAMRVLAVPVVLAIRSTYLAGAAALGHLVLHTRPSRSEVVGVGLTLVGAVLVAVLGGVRGDGAAGVGVLLVMVGLFVVAVVVGLLAEARLGDRPATGVVEAVAAGLGFAVLDLGVRLLPDPLTLGALVTSPAVWLGGLGGVVGLWLFARAATRLPVGPASALLVAVELVVASAVAWAALGDRFAGPPALVLLAVAALLAGAVLVSRAPQAVPARAAVTAS